MVKNDAPEDRHPPGIFRRDTLHIIDGILPTNLSNRPMRLLRYLWAFPNTAVGLLLVLPALATGGRVQRVRGVVEIHGGLVAWLLRHAVPLKGGALALTLGHVVLGRSAETLARCRAHEHVHVRQAERWGLFFVPAYFASSLRAWLRGQDPYYDNVFEREAFATIADA